jgi:DNA (cytosine-5)-methyltransferase 1
MNKKKYGYIELFAGCGGLSLGLKAAGFNLILANELSPLAAETFSYNFFNENLDDLAEKGKCPKNTLWLKSNYSSNQLIQRLKENPKEAIKGRISDFYNDVNLENKLIVGDIRILIKQHAFRNLSGKIDLLAGGPPCQSFSIAGRREKKNKRNQLSWFFAEAAGILKPRIILLENVSGILRPFYSNNRKWYAWFEVAKIFAMKGYVPICLHVNAKYFSVPQNRPRFIMVGFRKDVLDVFIQKSHIDAVFLEILNNSQRFYNEVNEFKMRLQRIGEIDTAFLKIIDLSNNGNQLIKKYFDKLHINFNNFHLVSTEEAIDDIKNKKDKYVFKTVDNMSNYAKVLLKEFGNVVDSSIILTNHERRKHSNIVKSRFRLLQLIEYGGTEKTKYSKMLKIALQKSIINVQLLDYFLGKKLYINSNSSSDKWTLETVTNKERIKELLKLLKTRKYSQKALEPDNQAPTQLTIPDDICHYDVNHLRTLTVREIARIQTFPDWFKFRGKATTGGMKRCLEVPQYTQVGNAVPPLMAKFIGESIRQFLEKVDKK